MLRATKLRKYWPRICLLGIPEVVSLNTGALTVCLINLQRNRKILLQCLGVDSIHKRAPVGGLLAGSSFEEI